MAHPGLTPGRERSGQPQTHGHNPQRHPSDAVEDRAPPAHAGLSQVWFHLPPQALRITRKRGHSPCPIPEGPGMPVSIPTEVGLDPDVAPRHRQPHLALPAPAGMAPSAQHTTGTTDASGIEPIEMIPTTNAQQSPPAQAGLRRCSRYQRYETLPRNHGTEPARPSGDHPGPLSTHPRSLVRQKYLVSTWRNGVHPYVAVKVPQHI